MAKQTMGTPMHAWGHRTDTKLFRLQNPQAPLVQNAAQAEYGFDEYPSGCNAIVAVIAYTGYDMEDACIINKSSFERGFGHASVYKVFSVDLITGRPAADATRFVLHNTYVSPTEQPFGENNNAVKGRPRPAHPGVGALVAPGLDSDGLPAPGTRLVAGDVFYMELDVVKGEHKPTYYKDLEPAYVDEVRLLAGPGLAGAPCPGPQRASIKLRYNRNPIVGDKFSSRHGQKGVLSYLWPTSDMPFSDGGMSPDIIINPHAFPSRMTIGMLVESMAGKSGALSGAFQDATPFRYDDGSATAAGTFGHALASQGYAYYGTERMYSGVTGEALSADIYIGVVYYQRLRHMVSDKAQVRSVGKVNALTRQPVKGRKKGGGIRFGEMERDSLLAHGASFLLHDRLFNSSDRHVGLVCGKCGSMLSAISTPCPASEVGGGGAATAGREVARGMVGGASTKVKRDRRAPTCVSCGDGLAVQAVALPYVLRYLANELAALGLRLKLELGTARPGPM